ncbi:MAG: chemotaxis protein CheW [Planctomycetota bacterium]
MLVLLFHIGRDRYALDTRHVIEILPLASLKTIPHAPTWVAGLLDYRGTTVPIVDLCQLANQRPAARAFSSRNLIVSYQRTGDADVHKLGLTVERVLRTQRMEPGDFDEAGVDIENAHYLGRVATTEDGIVQLVEPHDLLTDDVHRLLFPKAAQPA